MLMWQRAKYLMFSLPLIPSLSSLSVSPLLAHLAAFASPKDGDWVKELAAVLSREQPPLPQDTHLAEIKTSQIEATSFMCRNEDQNISAKDARQILPAAWCFQKHLWTFASCITLLPGTSTQLKSSVLGGNNQGQRKGQMRIQVALHFKRHFCKITNPPNPN